MGCEILDFRCIFVNELVGSVTLAVLFGVIFYFVFASKIRLGFDTTIAFAVPLILLIGIAVSGISTVMAFTTLFVALLLAFIFTKMIGQ